MLPLLIASGCQESVTTMCHAHTTMLSLFAQGGVCAAAAIAHLLLSRGGVRRLIWGSGGAVLLSERKSHTSSLK